MTGTWFLEILKIYYLRRKKILNKLWREINLYENKCDAHRFFVRYFHHYFSFSHSLVTLIPYRKWCTKFFIFLYPKVLFGGKKQKDFKCMKKFKFQNKEPQFTTSFVLFNEKVALLRLSSIHFEFSCIFSSRPFITLQ
jgi:hypothetical protein